jgi:deoxyribonuclease I
LTTVSVTICNPYPRVSSIRCPSLKHTLEIFAEASGLGSGAPGPRPGCGQLSASAACRPTAQGTARRRPDSDRDPSAGHGKPWIYGSTTPGIEPGPERLPKVAGSFSTAKKWLYERVYYDRQQTFYCGCDYDRNNRIDLSSCGLESLAGNTRAERVEAEHVFPASQFGNFRPCWREPERFEECTKSNGKTLSGRACCERVDPVFEAAHNDLHNLYPAVGQVNGQRSDYNWGMVSSRDAETFGTCNIRIDASIRRVQPPEAVRGDIARTMLYMRDTYGFRLSSQDTQLFTAWNNQDPPDAWEIERSRRIKAIQGIGNRYVEEYKRL